MAIQWGLRDAPILWFAALRALVAGVALLGVGGVQHRQRPSGARAWALITVLGLVNVTIGFAAMFAGVAGLATGAAAVLANAQPLLILLPAWWLYGERVSRRTAGALVVGFAGLVLVAAPGGGGLDVIVASGWHFLIGGVVLAVVAAVVEGAPVIAWTPRFIAALAFLSLLGSAAAFVAWFTETLRSRLDVLSAWTFLTPVFGIVLATVALGERVSGWTTAGLVAVLAAIGTVVLPGPNLDEPRPSQGTRQ